MYTDCPACQRQFRIRAGQLSAAAGLVQCGYCGRQFNALERLRDKPLPAATEDDKWFDLPEGTPAAPSEAAAGAGEAGIAVAGRSDAAPETGEAVAGIEAAAAGTDAGPAVTSDGPAAGEPAGTDIPPEWLVEETPRRGRLSRFAWGSGLLILLLAGTAQLAWFNRDYLLTRYPEILPQARRLCDYFQCQLIRHRDLSAIEVVNRDVRDHPRYRDALLVNATISNRSAEVQPFPVVQLSLFDTAGRVIASRRFSPGEYLDESIDIERGMLPDKPVHIVLEVTGPTEGAVSFEFRFLRQG